MTVEIYSKSDCPFCDAAKSLLTKHSLTYTEYSVGVNGVTRDTILKRFDDESIQHPNKLTVPQIWIDKKYIGGYDNLSKFLGKK